MLIIIIATYAAAILFRLSNDQSNDLKNRLSQDVMSALHRPMLIHDAPAMNYYVSEGSAGTGLGWLKSNNGSLVW